MPPAIVIAAGVGLVVLDVAIIAVTMRRHSAAFRRGEAVLRRWAALNSLQFVGIDHRAIFRGPFTLYGSNPVYRITVRDRQRDEHRGWVLCDLRARRAKPDEDVDVDVRWDGSAPRSNRGVAKEPTKGPPGDGPSRFVELCKQYLGPLIDTAGFTYEGKGMGRVHRGCSYDWAKPISSDLRLLLSVTWQYDDGDQLVGATLDLRRPANSERSSCPQRIWISQYIRNRYGQDVPYVQKVSGSPLNWPAAFAEVRRQLELCLPHLPAIQAHFETNDANQEGDGPLTRWGRLPALPPRRGPRGVAIASQGGAPSGWTRIPGQVLTHFVHPCEHELGPLLSAAGFSYDGARGFGDAFCDWARPLSSERRLLFRTSCCSYGAWWVGASLRLERHGINVPFIATHQIMTSTYIRDRLGQDVPHLHEVLGTPLNWTAAVGEVRRQLELCLPHFSAILAEWEAKGADAGM